jgi:hypothetical protein
MIGEELENCAVRGILTSPGTQGGGIFSDFFGLVDVRIKLTTYSIFASQGVNNQVQSLKRVFRIFCYIAMASK